jgi:hypothetical protein
MQAVGLSNARVVMIESRCWGDFQLWLLGPPQARLPRCSGSLPHRSYTHPHCSGSHGRRQQGVRCEPSHSACCCLCRQRHLHPQPSACACARTHRMVSECRMQPFAPARNASKNIQDEVQRIRQSTFHAAIADAVEAWRIRGCVRREAPVSRSHGSVVVLLVHVRL